MTFGELAQDGAWLLLVAIVVAAWAGGHVILRKRDPRAALGWVGLILLVPLLGATLYFVFGVNRVSRRAESLYADHLPESFDVETCTLDADDLEAGVFDGVLESRVKPSVVELARFVDGLVPTHLCIGNRVEPLTSGRMAYDAMLAAIDGAERTLALSTYIFDHDAVGNRFRRALAAAHRRGVEVRVLIDAMGDRYSWPPMRRLLARDGVPAASFMPTLWPQYLSYSNLRNHRKLLVADGRVVFTGGMNIRHGHLLDEAPKNPVRDLHFRVEGPIVASLLQVFVNDWAFAANETLRGEAWFPRLEQKGEVVCRAIDDGPAGRFDQLRWTLLGALACARHRVRIVTPYFLPDEALIVGLSTAARRGVEVEILLPEVNNLLLVQWASTALLWQVLQPGCRVFLTPRPFDHSKLCVIDDEWSLIGSANWDPRSLRLNFELNLACISKPLAAQLGAEIDARRAAARELDLATVDGRSLPVRLRDGLARLASPYL
ncbi:MAG: phospholipase D-like domain-containing protein [Acidobacteriota bacterium]